MSKLTSGTLTPAYGRDYKSKKEAIDAFESGKDFVYHNMLDEGYVNKADFQTGSRIMIRYKRMTQVTSHIVQPTKAEQVVDGMAHPLSIGAVLNHKAKK